MGVVARRVNGKRVRTSAPLSGGAEGVDYVFCQGCGLRFRSITSDHLRTHNLTVGGYIERYSSAAMHCSNLCDELRTFLGKTHTLESRGKISRGVSGEKNGSYGKCGPLNPATRPEVRKKLSQILKGEGNGMFGKKHTLAWRREHSEVMKLNNPMKRPEVAVKLRGKGNGNWHHGRAYEPYTADFTDSLKDEIRARDGYVCQLCGVPQAECLRLLDVHHIDYDKRNNDKGNLVSLCIACHGKTNGKREYYKSYLKLKGGVR